MPSGCCRWYCYCCCTEVMRAGLSSSIVLARRCMPRMPLLLSDGWACALRLRLHPPSITSWPCSSRKYGGPSCRKRGGQLGQAVNPLHVTVAPQPCLPAPAVVNVKAKTHEKVDSLGENRSIAAEAVVLLLREEAA